MALLLEHLHDPAAAFEAATRASAMMQEMFPLCRSITGNGVRHTLDIIGRTLPLERHEVPSGTPVFDWEVPKEWNVRDAYVADAHGRRLIDFQAHNLHIVNYSTPVRATLSRGELEPHLHSLPQQPDWIPYRTTYYKETWGFCLRHRDRERLGEGPFEVVIDAELAPGHLTYAETCVPGASRADAIVYTHTCHPSLANDNLTGMAVATVLAAELRKQTPRLTWRFIFGPGTIGSLTWLSRNEATLDRIQAGLVLGLLGDMGPLTYKRSRKGDCVTDRAAQYVLGTTRPDALLVDFEPYGYDERQFCSPGFDLPVGRVTRSSNGTYPEYHTSADDLALVRTDKLADSIQALANMLGVIDANGVPVNLCPKGEPRLGKRGLYGALGGKGPGPLEHALLWILNLGDGSRDLLGIAARSGLEFSLLERAARALEAAGLVETREDVSASSVRSIQ